VAHHLASATDAGREFYGILRDIVQRHAPEATEEISYSMPVFLVDGKRLLHAAPWKAHLAIYPLPEERDLDPQLRCQHAEAALQEALPDRAGRRRGAGPPGAARRRPL